MKKAVRDVAIRYSLATIGLLLVALGVALSIISNLGTSPLSCPSYILAGTFNLTVGNWTILVNILYVFIQLAVLGRNFKLKYLMQIPASFIFGYLIDLMMFCCQWIHFETFIGRMFLIILSCVVTALGTSIEVIARGWMLSAEMTVYAFTKRIKKPFGIIKIVMDSSLVVISAVIACLMYGNLFGSGKYEGIVHVITGQMSGVVIGTGTLIMAFLIGWMMRFTDPVADRVMDKIIERILSNSSSQQS